MWRPNSLWTWSFLLLAIVQATLCLALEGYVFAKFRDDVLKIANVQGLAYNRTIPTYLALLILGFIYEIVLVFDALAAKNTIQVIGICMMNLAMMVYTAIQIDQIHEAFVYLNSQRLIRVDYWSDVHPYLIALPAITGLGTVALSFMAYKLYEEFAWTIYKQISADLRLKRRYLVYQIYIALLKFDLFLFAGFVMQFLIIVEGTTGVEFDLTVAALPVVLILLGIAWLSTKRENILGMALTIFFYFVMLAYFIFKLVRMYDSTAARQADYEPARTTLTTFAAITIVFLLITIVIAFVCTSNFKKGLAPHVSKSARAKEEKHGGDKVYMNDVRPHYAETSPQQPFHTGGGSRMEID